MLVKFYRSVRPHVSGWQPVARLAPEVPQTRDLGRNLLSWVLGLLHGLHGAIWPGTRAAGAILGRDWVADCGGDLCGRALFKYLPRWMERRSVSARQCLPGV